MHISIRSLLLALSCLMLLAPPTLRGQDSLPKATQDDRGLVVPTDVTPQAGNGRRVVVKNLAGDAVVAKVYLDMTSRYVVLLPDGRLISVPVAEATATDRPFAPLSKDALARQLTSGPFKGFKSSATARFVYVYNASGPFYKATHSILETMYPALEAWCKRAGLDVHEPDVPMVVIMFKSEEQFRYYWDAPEGMRAFYNPVNNFIVMYEPALRSAAAQQIYSTIAHEGEHQILGNLGVQQRLSRWPLWFVEGLAEYFAPTETGRRIRWQGVGRVNPIRRQEFIGYLQQAQRRGDDLSGGALVRKTVAADKLDLELYANSWALVHYLARSRPDDFNAYLREVAALKGFTSAGDGLALFQKHFGDDFATIQAGLLQHVQTAR